MEPGGGACAILSCKYADRKHIVGLSYHRIPKRGIGIRQKWLEVIRNARGDANWEPTVNSSVCSRHFETAAYDSNNKSLRFWAVPSLLLRKQSDATDKNGTTESNVDRMQIEIRDPLENEIIHIIDGNFDENPAVLSTTTDTGLPFVDIEDVEMSSCTEETVDEEVICVEPIKVTSSPLTTIDSVSGVSSQSKNQASSQPKGKMGKTIPDPGNMSQMYKCAIFNCTVDARKLVPDLSWHKLPGSSKYRDVRRERWMEIVKRCRPPGTITGHYDRFCSRHFSPSVLYNSRGGVKMINHNAYPFLCLPEYVNISDILRDVSVEKSNCLVIGTQCTPVNTTDKLQPLTTTDSGLPFVNIKDVEVSSCNKKTDTVTSSSTQQKNQTSSQPEGTTEKTIPWKTLWSENMSQKYKCAIFNCTAEDRKLMPNLSWHKFPAYNVQRERWMEIAKRCRPPFSTQVWSDQDPFCSRHFSPSVLYNSRRYRESRMAKPNAYPTLCLPEYVDISDILRDVAVVRTYCSAISIQSRTVNTTNKLQDSTPISIIQPLPAQATPLPTVCLICTAKCSSNVLNEQHRTEIQFMLNTLLCISTKNLDNTDPIASSINVCHTCLELVAQAHEKSQQIERLQDEINNTKTKLKITLHKSCRRTLQSPDRGKSFIGQNTLYQKIYKRFYSGEIKQSSLSQISTESLTLNLNPKSPITYSRTSRNHQKSDVVESHKRFDEEPELLSVPSAEIHKSQLDEEHDPLGQNSTLIYYPQEDENESTFSVQQHPSPNHLLDENESEIHFVEDSKFYVIQSVNATPISQYPMDSNEAENRSSELFLAEPEKPIQVKEERDLEINNIEAEIVEPMIVDVRTLIKSNPSTNPIKKKHLLKCLTCQRIFPTQKQLTFHQETKHQKHAIGVHDKNSTNSSVK